MSSLYNNIFDNNSGFFDHSPPSQEKKQSTTLVGRDTINIGTINTIYGVSGVGVSYYSNYLLSMLEETLVIYTENLPVQCINSYILSTTIEEIRKIIQASVLSGVKYILIDKVSSIVCDKELQDDFSSLDNTYPSLIMESLIKDLKFYCSRYNTTFFLISNINSIENKTDEILKENSSQILNISKDKYLYAYGDLVGYRIIVNNNKYKLLFNDQILPILK